MRTKAPSSPRKRISLDQLRLYRSRAASSIAVDAPGDVDIIPAVLGHGSPKTAEKHYNLAGSREALRAGRLIDDLRQRLSRRPRRRPASFRR
jgi:hypothetical protein